MHKAQSVTVWLQIWILEFRNSLLWHIGLYCQYNFFSWCKHTNLTASYTWNKCCNIDIDHPALDLTCSRADTHAARTQPWWAIIQIDKLLCFPDIAGTKNDFYSINVSTFSSFKLCNTFTGVRPTISYSDTFQEAVQNTNKYLRSTSMDEKLYVHGGTGVIPFVYH